VSDLTYISAVILGIVEGLTEFLPVSSTGHLTITEKLLGLQVDAPEVTAYTAIIQLGAGFGLGTVDKFQGRQAAVVFDRLSPHAAAVRDALLAAREPDDLMFTTLPTACGVAPITLRTSRRTADEYVQRLYAAALELDSAYRTLLEWIGSSLSEALALPTTVDMLRRDLQTLGRQIGDKILDPRLQSFVHLAEDEMLDDPNWLEAIGLSLSEKPPAA